MKKALFAEEAHKVDGIHAGPYTTDREERANELMATNNKGRLPNNIVNKVRDTAKLAGANGSQYLDRDARTLVVDQTGRAEFTTIQGAIDSITDASSTKRYRISVLSGTYEEQVVVPPFIDVIGAGVHRPVVTCACSQGGNTSLGTAGTLTLTGNNLLRNIVVVNTGGSSYGHALEAHGTDNRIVAVHAKASGSAVENLAIWSSDTPFGEPAAATRAQGTEDAPDTLVLKNVFAEASGGALAIGLASHDVYVSATDSEFAGSGATQGSPPLNQAMLLERGIHDLTRIVARAQGQYPARSDGIRQRSSKMTLRDSTIRAVGTSFEYYGFVNDASDATLDNVWILSANGDSNYGIRNMNGSGANKTVLVERSVIDVNGSGFSVWNDNTGVVTRIAASRIDGPPTANTSPSVLTCVATYDEDFVFSAEGCPS